jgi:hypothetical protein
MKRKSASKKKSRAKPQENEIAQLLRQLVSINTLQTNREAPTIFDVKTPKLKRHKVYPFVRSVELGLITPSVTVETDGAYAFSLGSLPDYTEFTALFDTYRIISVRICFYPLFTDTSATVAYPPIHTVIDYDDNNTLALNILNEYDSLQVVQTGQFFERTLTPRIALAAYSGVFTSFSQPPAKSWIDCASPNVTHYGLKYAVAISGAANAVWQVTAHYSLEFRESR